MFYVVNYDIYLWPITPCLHEMCNLKLFKQLWWNMISKYLAFCLCPSTGPKPRATATISNGENSNIGCLRRVKLDTELKQELHDLHQHWRSSSLFPQPQRLCDGYLCWCVHGGISFLNYFRQKHPGVELWLLDITIILHLLQ